jgi:hypothetical protein
LHLQGNPLAALPPGLEQRPNLKITRQASIRKLAME